MENVDHNISGQVDRSGEDHSDLLARAVADSNAAVKLVVSLSPYILEIAVETKSVIATLNLSSLRAHPVLPGNQSSPRSLTRPKHASVMPDAILQASSGTFTTDSPSDRFLALAAVFVFASVH